MKKSHILIVEDDEDIQQLVSFNMIKSGFNVTCADDGQNILSILEGEQIDCILLDIMLPGKSGLEICSQIRQNEEFSDLPIVMLTAKRQESEVIAGLESGADDYITKPFSPKLLVARVKAALRRGGKPAEETQKENRKISTHGIEINPGRHEVLLHGKKINLTVTEFSILAVLAGRPGWTYSRQQIIDTIRGSHYIVTPRMIDVQVFSLRKKLGEDGVNIETVRGVGYRFKD